MHLDELLVVSPRVGDTAINFRVYALDGSPAAMQAVERMERAGLSGLEEFMHWLDHSEHSSGEGDDNGPPNMFSIEVSGFLVNGCFGVL